MYTKDSLGCILILGTRQTFKQSSSFDNLRTFHELGLEIISTGAITGDLEKRDIPYSDISLNNFSQLSKSHQMPNGDIIASMIADPDDKVDSDILTDNALTYIKIVFWNITDFRSFVHHSNRPKISDIDVVLFTYLISAIMNSEHVTAIVDAEDLGIVAAELRENGEVSASTKSRLAIKALNKLAENLAYIARIVRAYSVDATTNLARV